MIQRSNAAAIILAGGMGARMGGKVPKQFAELCGRPVLWYSLEAFCTSAVDEIIVAAAPGYEDETEMLIKKYGFLDKKSVKVVTGGSERFLSVYEALKALGSVGADSVILIHDAARPLVSREIIEKNIDMALKYGACVTCVKAKDTIKLSAGCEPPFIKETPPRDLVYIAQTPQSFTYELIMAAYDKLIASGQRDATDDAMVVERFMPDKTVYIAEGDYHNIKLTTTEDMEIAEAMLRNRGF